MAAEGVTYDEIVAATGICENKSSLATILANPIYRGLRVFNREARVEGEHGRKRRRNPAEDVVTSEVEAVVPEQLWTRVQEMLVRRRKDRFGAAAIRGRLRADGAAPVRVRVANGGHEQSVIPLLPLQGALRSTKRAGERPGCRRHGPDPPDPGDPEGCPGYGQLAQRGHPDARRAACARSR
jgi:hypothetical protein